MSSFPKTTLKRGGKKTHGCKMCHYSSTFASNLKLHVLVHSGGKTAQLYAVQLHLHTDW